MAKPGSAAARAIAAGGAADLSGARLTDTQARALQEQVEIKIGARCNGCGRRVTLGFRFTSIDPRATGREMIEMVACTRGDCDFAIRARDGATVVEPVEFRWLDEAGADAPAAGVIVKRNERMAAAEAKSGG